MTSRRASLALSLVLLGCGRASTNTTAATPTTTALSPDARLEFRVEGRAVRTLTLRELDGVTPAETVTNFDPYYGRVKRFRAYPLAPVLAHALAGATAGPVATRSFILRARDGYTVPIAGERLLEGGAYLAVRDDERPSWEPIGPQRADPGPVYLVWSGAAQTNLDTHPRPWQLAVIEVARFEAAFPHTAPEGEPRDGPAWRGHALFGQLCVRCHAVNREGGRVGPDLNVPRSVTEYRPEEQIRAYIRDPRTFRYGNMPSHPGLTDADLDALLAYLRAMASRKHDPDARDGGA